MYSYATLVCLLLSISLGESAPWGYDVHNGPSRWGEFAEACDGDRQSPIDIQTGSIIYNETLSGFQMTGYDVTEEQDWKIKNSGRSVQVDLSGHYTLNGGGLEGTYKAVQFHFHWGHDNSAGAEHTIDGQKYPLELHIVHYAQRYGDVAGSLDHGDGLAVLGFLFKIGAKENPSYKQLIDSLQNIKHSGDNMVMKPEALTSMMPHDLTDYYRYDGSLTTPPCKEAVIWTLFKEPIEISAEQMQAIRSTLMNTEGAPLKVNYRPTLPLNGRIVYSSDPDDVETIRPFMSSSFALLVAAMIGFLIINWWCTSHKHKNQHQHKD